MKPSRRFLRLALIATAALLLYLPGLGRPALWEPDEGRYAEIAREMYLSGDYVTPRNDYVRYFEKPPLMYWAETASIAVLGQNEFAVRLPAALFSAGQVVVAAALADAMLGPIAALLAAVALALSPLFFGFARFVTLDPGLSFFMVAALASFYAAARSEDFGSGAGRRWFRLSAAMLAMGTLTKGPVALLLAGAVALAWLVAEGRTREALRMPWISSIALFCALTVPWFVLVAERNPGFLRFFFIHEHVDRYLKATEHGWGPWFFVPIVLAGTWPWFFFVPDGVRAMSRSGERVRSDLRFLLIWFGLIFVFFSIPRSKLGEYILPAIPALAIVAGAGMQALLSFDAARIRRTFGWFAGINVALSALAAAALLIAGYRLPPAMVRDGLMIASAVATTAVVCFAIAARGRHARAAVFALVLGMVVAMGLASRVRRDAASLATYRNLARQASRHLGPGCVLASYRHFVQSLPFYTGFREAMVSFRGELAPFSRSPDAQASFIPNDADLSRIWASGACMVLIADRPYLPQLFKELNPRPVIVGCEGKKFALLNNPASASDADCVARANEPPPKAR